MPRARKAFLTSVSMRHSRTYWETSYDDPAAFWTDLD
jgi:hypothetical protein